MEEGHQRHCRQVFAYAGTVQTDRDAQLLICPAGQGMSWLAPIVCGHCMPGSAMYDGGDDGGADQHFLRLQDRTKAITAAVQVRRGVEGDVGRRHRGGLCCVSLV